VKELTTRTLTGAGLVVLMAIAILLGKYSFFLFFALLIVGSLWEFYNISELLGKHPQKISGITIGIVVFLFSFLYSSGYVETETMLLIILGILYLIISELYRKHQEPFENIASTIMGIIYIAVPISMLWPIVFRDNIYQFNYHLILSYFIIIWTYDSFAYLTGVVLGKTKLFERISPKKSWEGAIGGFVFALLAAYILSRFFNELTMYQWFVFAAITTVFGTFGDLAESLLKRSADIKDSGNILPGHGGLLDRFDAMFLAIPALYLYLQFI
jgi:phosphatidate cytidylyltransferase